MKKEFIISVAIAIFGAVLFSTKAILVKLVYHQEDIDGATLLTLRMIFASPFYLVSLLRLQQNKQEGVDYQQIIKYSFLTGVLFYLSALFDFMGLRYVNAGIERLVLFVYPTLVLLFSALFFKEKIKRYQWQALMMTYAGVVLAFLFEIYRQQSSNDTLLLGGGLILLSSTTYAFFIIVNGKVVQRFGVERFTNFTMLWATVCMLLHFGVSHSFSKLFDYQANTYQLVLAMAVFSTVIPSYLMALGIKRIGANNAAIVNSIGPVSTILQAWLILDENISFAQLIGTAMVISGIWWIGKKG
jgi:drug/metabolite transporter (DMT)-like permease